MDTDWTRFDYYARWVKSLVLDLRWVDSRAESQLDGAETVRLVHDRLADYKREHGLGKLIPNLRSLTIESPYIIPIARRFLGPELDHLVVEVYYPPRLGDVFPYHNLVDLFSTIPQCANNVKNIRAYCYIAPGSELAVARFSECLCNLDMLVQVDCLEIEISKNALLHLARLPHLEVLEMGCLPADVFTRPSREAAVSDHDHKNYFPSLRALTLETRSWVDCAPILHVISGKLAGLQVYMTPEGLVEGEVQPMSRLPKFLEILAACRIGKTIHTLSLMDNISKPVDVDGMPCLPSVILKPLLGLPGIKHLALRLGKLCRSDALDDTWLKDVAKTWPALERFTFMTGVDTDDIPIGTHFTMKGLMALTAGCPNLRLLDITLDASDTDCSGVSDSDDKSFIYNTKISFLRIQPSTIRDPNEVVDCLTRILPGICCILEDSRIVREGYLVIASDDSEEEDESREFEQRIAWRIHQAQQGLMDEAFVAVGQPQEVRFWKKVFYDIRNRARARGEVRVDVVNWWDMEIRS